MFDVAKFIECVQEKPALWEKKLKEYSDKNVREKCWSSIGAEMFEKWMELSAAEKQEKVKDMKNKWRHIRDSFLKTLNLGKSGDAAPQKRKYVYADILTFLLTSAEKRRTSGNVAEDEGEQEREFDNENTIEEDEHGGPEGRHGNAPAKKSLRKSGITTFQSKLLEKLDSAKHEEQDADKAFLLSLLPDYKALNAEQKIDFRLHALQFFRGIKRGGAEQTLQPPPPLRDISSHQNYQFHCSVPFSSQYQYPPQYQYPQFRTSALISSQYQYLDSRTPSPTSSHPSQDRYPSASHTPLPTPSHHPYSTPQQQSTSSEFEYCTDSPNLFEM